jgi:hypothetical protein
MTPAAVARYAAPLHCAINGTVVFHWAAQWHDLQRFASKQHMEDCDFDDAQLLAAAGGAAGTATSFYLACATPGEEIHVGCSVEDHCSRGQKLSIHVSPSVHALAADGSPLLHVDSYARVMDLLGHTIDAEGFVHLTRGFQTDHLAETSLDFVWCVLRATCPSHPRPRHSSQPLPIAYPDHHPHSPTHIHPPSCSRPHLPPPPQPSTLTLNPQPPVLTLAPHVNQVPRAALQPRRSIDQRLGRLRHPELVSRRRLQPGRIPHPREALAQPDPGRGLLPHGPRAPAAPLPHSGLPRRAAPHHRQCHRRQRHRA